MWVASELFSLETGAASDMGRVRDHNEDAFMARPAWAGMTLAISPAARLPRKC
jgi:serine/threonine protein phosphatase PrpC